MQFSSFGMAEAKETEWRNKAERSENKEWIVMFTLAKGHATHYEW